MSIKMACAQAALSDLALPHINIALLILQLIPHLETRKERVKTGRRKRKKTQDRTRNDGATGRGIGNIWKMESGDLKGPSYTHSSWGTKRKGNKSHFIPFTGLFRTCHRECALNRENSREEAARVYLPGYIQYQGLIIHSFYLTFNYFKPYTANSPKQSSADCNPVDSIAGLKQSLRVNYITVVENRTSIFIACGDLSVSRLHQRLEGTLFPAHTYFRCRANSNFSQSVLRYCVLRLKSI